jgi:hypothetical protein
MRSYKASRSVMVIPSRSEWAMRCVVGRRPKRCFSSVALLALCVGLASALAIDRASAQARTTTTTTVTRTTPPFGTITITTTTFGANTGGIAASAVRSAVQTALQGIQGIQKRKTADRDVKPPCGARAALGEEPVGTVQWARYRKCIKDQARTRRLDWSRSLSLGAPLTPATLRDQARSITTAVP